MARNKKPPYAMDGLNAIMSGVAAEVKLPDVRPIEIDMLYIGPQPRQMFGLIDNFEDNKKGDNWLLPVATFLSHLKSTAASDENSVAKASLTELESMSRSIQEHGVLQPILVRYQENEERYIITDGHRRALAALLAGLATIEAKVKRDWTDTEVLSEQLIANLQRKDLTALELARAIAQLRELYLGQVKETEPKIHPNQLAKQVWDRLEASLGVGRRQLQRLMQLHEFIEDMEPKWVERVATMKERQFRPLFRLAKEDQPAALMLVALNSDRNYQDYEALVERRLNGEDLLAIAKVLGMIIPAELEGGSKVKSAKLQDLPPDGESLSDANNGELELQYQAYNTKNVLAALKRMPREPEYLLQRLEQELKEATEKERIKRLHRIEEVEQEALKLSNRLSELRKKYSPLK